ncbi:MAG: hypothetical protein U1E14_02645 [Geminicoccaceae bacterium]
MRTLTVVALLALLAASGLVAWWIWEELGDVELGLYGWLALGGGSAATLLLAVVLVVLMHISARRGFDDRAGRED